MNEVAELWDAAILRDCQPTQDPEEAYWSTMPVTGAQHDAGMKARQERIRKFWGGDGNPIQVSTATYGGTIAFPTLESLKPHD